VEDQCRLENARSLKSQSLRMKVQRRGGVVKRVGSHGRLVAYAMVMHNIMRVKRTDTDRLRGREYDTTAAVVALSDDWRCNMT
jgi:hypothetical protein